LTLLYRPGPVSAHNPTSVTLEYNSGSGTLTVTVAHSVPIGSLPSHYIYTITVEKNSVEVVTRDYVSENNTVSGLTDTFTISATDGDVLSATARCTQSGLRTGQLTVGATTPPDGNGTPISFPLIIAIVVAVLAIVGILVALLRRR
jgi:hypothetical protein